MSAKGPCLLLLFCPLPRLSFWSIVLTESQAWFIGWLRDGTRSPELLDAIKSVEVQARRKKEIGSPPACSMELPKLKAMLEARIQDKDTNWETIVRRWVSAYLGDKDWG
jgi:predicted GNAT superfamily acetyltransferase